MILRKIYKENDINKITAVGQLSMVIGLGCTSGVLLLNRFGNVHDFLLGFMTGIGAVAMIVSIIFNVKSLRMRRSAG